jgi:hypothetical protein
MPCIQGATSTNQDLHSRSLSLASLFWSVLFFLCSLLRRRSQASQGFLGRQGHATGFIKGRGNLRCRLARSPLQLESAVAPRPLNYFTTVRRGCVRHLRVHLVSPVCPSAPCEPTARPYSVVRQLTSANPEGARDF